MDEFLRTLYVAFYKYWIVTQLSTLAIFDLQETVSAINFSLDKTACEITFNPCEIIELTVINKRKETTEFYLHFQMNNLKHAITIFHEMIKSIKNIEDSSQTKVLLCCSGGLTTGYFAFRLNEAITALELDIEVSATGYEHLFEEAKDYEMIFLAPQISYKLPEVIKYLNNIPVEIIPTPIFAKYDMEYMIKRIKELAYKQIKNQNLQKISFNQGLQKGKYLCLSVYQNRYKYYLNYRVYDDNDTILVSNELVKPTLTIEDIYGVIDSLLGNNEISKIALCLPGIVENSYISSSFIIGANGNLGEVISHRYNKEVLIINDVNAATLGFYKQNSNYKNFSLLFQPIGIDAGMGSIIDGELFLGTYGMAGEIKFIPLNLSKDRHELSLTPEGTIELVSQILITVASLIAPPVFVLACDLISDVTLIENKIKAAFNQHINNYDIKIIKINSLQSYTLEGLNYVCQ